MAVILRSHNTVNYKYNAIIMVDHGQINYLNIGIDQKLPALEGVYGITISTKSATLLFHDSNKTCLSTKSGNYFFTKTAIS